MTFKELEARYGKQNRSEIFGNTVLSGELNIFGNTEIPNKKI